MNTAECKAARDVIEGVIQEMRDDPDTGTIWCNLLENHVNALLGDFRSRTHCTIMEIPQIQTFESG